MKYENIIKHRNQWMGIAILWIILFHSDINAGFFNQIKQIGYGGVDIFLFASGIGCFHSLNKNPDIIQFFKKRVRRILPSYYIFLPFYLAYKIIINSITFQEICGNIFCIGWLLQLENQFNWYINAIWLFYILAPFAFLYIQQSRSIHESLFLLLFFLIINVPFLNTDWLIMSSRFPVFFMGMVFSSIWSKKETMKLKYLIFSFIAMITGFIILFFCISRYNNHLWNYGLWWFPFIFITPGLCFLLSFIFESFSNKFIRFSSHFLSLIGSHTFELYLIHIFIFEVIEYMVNMKYIPNTSLYWVSGFIAAIPASLILHKISSKLQKNLPQIKC